MNSPSPSESETEEMSKQMMNSPSPSESETEEMSKQMMSFHDHPLLVYDEIYSSCDLCLTGDEISDTFYKCRECRLEFHKECIEYFLDHPLQSNHYFKLFKTLEHDQAHYCHFCGRKDWYSYARCMIYNITICFNCVAYPPPFDIFKPKHHKHNLTLLSRLVTFTCNACGLQSDRNPYVCLQCNFMVHEKCIDLPHVISINRHDHRISHTFHLGQGDWKCGVCRKTIDWIYGAFKCSRCPSYAVHSKCATRYEVWDGVELEDVPEIEEEIEDPYKVVNEKGDIIHFSHEIENHILRRLDENCVTYMLRCGGCVFAIKGDPCYKCVECEFVLHKECANLPRKKRHFLHNHKLVLQVDEKGFVCIACATWSNGFRYVCSEDDCKDEVFYDVRCSSLSEPFQHELHPQHPLYFTLEDSKECNACGEDTEDLLSCMDCEYVLCIACATLPKKVKNNRYDDHFLTLSQGVGNATSDLWCDICETKMDPNKLYYTCKEECGLSLHIDCVIGDFYYLKIGYVETNTNTEGCFEVVANNGATRPSCSRCEVLCKSSFLMKVTTKESVHYFCSIDCCPP